MSVSLDFNIISGRKGAGISFNFEPLVFLIANLTFLTFAVGTNQMTTFVTPNFLFTDFLPADPATKSVVQLMNFDIS